MRALMQRLGALAWPWVALGAALVVLTGAVVVVVVVRMHDAPAPAPFVPPPGAHIRKPTPQEAAAIQACLKSQPAELVAHIHQHTASQGEANQFVACEQDFMERAAIKNFHFKVLRDH